MISNDHHLIYRIDGGGEGSTEENFQNFRYGRDPLDPRFCHRMGSRETLSLLQEAYIKLVLEKFIFTDIKSYTALMYPNLKLSTADLPKTAQEFAAMCDKPY